MAMDVNEIDYFDDDIDDISQYSEPDLTGIDDNQEPIQETLYEFEEDDHQMSTNEDDVITTMLKNRGINPTAIKMQNENGEIEEVNFNDLSVEEQLQILQDENIEESYGLDDNEINLINTLRSNNFSVEDYNNYIAKKAIEDYLSKNQGNEPLMQVDLISDDELYLMDLKSRISSLSDEEALEELEHAKANTNLYNKKIQSLRDEYKQREQELAEEEQKEILAQQQAQAEEFERVIVEAINNNDSFDLGDSALELTVDDKNEIASFILDSDPAGVRYIAKALNDPKTLVRMAWYALKGDEAIRQIGDYYKQEIAKTAKQNYQKGYEDANSGKTASKSFVRKPASKKGNQPLTIDDIDF
jgi:hypothetical protein